MAKVEDNAPNDDELPKNDDTPTTEEVPAPPHEVEDKIEILAAEKVQNKNVPDADTLPEKVDAPPPELDDRDRPQANGEMWTKNDLPDSTTRSNMAGSSIPSPDGQQSTNVCAAHLIMFSHWLEEKTQAQLNNDKLTQQLFGIHTRIDKLVASLPTTSPGPRHSHQLTSARSVPSHQYQ